MHRPVHPFHAVLLAGTVPLFLAALLADLAYYETYQIQWKNFASWLLVGGLVFGGIALLWSIVDIVRDSQRTVRHAMEGLLLLALFAVGFINSLVHASDVWASMPTGLILSAIAVALAVAATWSGFSRVYTGVRV